MRTRRARPIRLQLLVVGMLALTAGCDGVGQVSPSASPSPTQSPSSSPAPSLKPMIHGLIDRNGPPPPGFAGAVTAFVVNVRWSDLQPTAYGPLAPNNAIDQAIATARRLGPAIGIKIRLFAGIDAPDWVKQQDGGPVSVFSPADQMGGTIGRFWTDDFGRAYSDVWGKLAALYDDVPEVREITVSRCMTVFAETFLRDTADPSTVSNLLAAGFSTATDQACIAAEIAQGSVWHHTRIGVAFNPYQEILADGLVRTDVTFTEAMMQSCRTELGSQCVIENNSIRWPPLAAGYSKMYADMQLLGPPLSFQTATASRIGDLQMTLSWAAGVGADAVELPSGYESLTPSMLQGFASALMQNPG